MKTINFISKKNIYFTISAVLILTSVLFSFVFGVNLDIQFKGGAIMTYSYEGSLNKTGFKSTVELILGESVNLQETTDIASGKNNIKVSLSANKGLSSEKMSALSEALPKEFADNKLETVSVVDVNPTIGREFFMKSIFAVAFAAILMTLYIALRFKLISGWSAGVMAVVALLHDILMVYATFVFLKIPINDNFIAVILTILGYSVNDTIVIYDRIRENKKMMGAKEPLANLVNVSITQTLRRTITTTVSTVLAMLVVAIVAVVYGVNSIISFAIPLIVGLVSGTYSTICIATPLWVTWEDRKKKHKNLPAEGSN